MNRRTSSFVMLVPMVLTSSLVWAGDEQTPPDAPAPAKSAATKSAGPGSSKGATAVEVSEAEEAQALGFVREHYPELADVVVALKPMNQAEYAKAVKELSAVSRSMGEMKLRNTRRYELMLDAWKAKTRVELLAARNAGAPSDERLAELRKAIEARLDVEIRRQKFELEQAEAQMKRSREMIDRLEANRDTIIENRYRALLPKKLGKAKKTAKDPSAAQTKPVAPTQTKPVAPKSTPENPTSKNDGEARR